MDVSVGIPCYNEERTIGKAIASVLGQRSRNIRIDEVLVVASGCTDGTSGEVRKQSERDGRIRLIVEPERRGKISALNIIFREARNEVVVMVDGDSIIGDGAVGKLAARFA